jgi:outer membrane protein assembly factor BamB
VAGLLLRSRLQAKHTLFALSPEASPNGTCLEFRKIPLQMYNAAFLNSTMEEKRAGLSFVFAGINGSVIALDETTGDQVWVTSLKGGEFVNLVLSENKLYATTKGEIFCLDPGTGNVLCYRPAIRGWIS